MGLRRRSLQHCLQQQVHFFALHLCCCTCRKSLTSCPRKIKEREREANEISGRSPDDDRAWSSGILSSERGAKESGREGVQQPHHTPACRGGMGAVSEIEITPGRNLTHL